MHSRRLEALSDSTFAVALTLLIFDVRVHRPQIHGVTHDKEPFSSEELMERSTDATLPA